MKKILFAGIAAAALIAAPAFAEGVGGTVGSTANGAVGGTAGSVAGGATGAAGGAIKGDPGMTGGAGGTAGGTLGAGPYNGNAGTSSGAMGGATGSLSPNTGAAGATGGMAANGTAAGWAPLAGSAKSDVKVGAKVVNANGDPIGTVSGVTTGADGKVTGVKIKTSAGAMQTASASDLSIKGGVLLSSKVSAQ